MSSNPKFEYTVADRYIKAIKLIKYLKKKFPNDNYKISMRSDTYTIVTPRELNPDEIEEINALSARYSSRINNTTSSKEAANEPKRSTDRDETEESEERRLEIPTKAANIGHWGRSFNKINLLLGATRAWWAPRNKT